MNRKYSISYFVLLTSVVLAFVLAYSLSSNSYQIEDSTAEELNIMEEEYVDGNVSSELYTEDSDAEIIEEEITEGYYVYNNNGYVSVLLYDKSTVLEYTEIEVVTLTDELQEELETGKYIKTIEELYGFLENYSS